MQELNLEKKKVIATGVVGIIIRESKKENVNHEHYYNR